MMLLKLMVGLALSDKMPPPARFIISPLLAMLPFPYSMVKPSTCGSMHSPDGELMIMMLPISESALILNPVRWVPVILSLVT